MALINSLGAGVSGLRGFQSKMDVIGNNIANVNTTGFKSGSVRFSELLSQNMSRGGQRFATAPSQFNQIGLGVRVSSIDQDNSQGALEASNRPTDLAVNGEGFFVVNDGETDMLTRAGNFSFNQDGKLVTPEGLTVQGFSANQSGSIVASGTARDIQIDFDQIFQPERTSNINLAGNLDSNTSTSQVVTSNQAFTANGGNLADATTLINDLDQTQTAFTDGDQIDINFTLNDGTTGTANFTFSDNGTPGDPSDDSTLGDLVNSIQTAFGTDANVSLQDGNINIRSNDLGESSLDFTLTNGTGTGVVDLPSTQIITEGTTNSKTISSTVYDDQGNAHTLVVDLTQTGTNQWEFDASFLNGETVTAGQTGTLTFDDVGNLTSVNSDPTAESASITFDPGTGGGTQTFSLNFESEGKSLNQFSGTTTANVASQDGFAKGELIDFAIDSEGLMIGNFSNGKSKNLAQIALGTVNNIDGLLDQGDNAFRTTAQSGEIRINTATSLADTSINSGFLEGSNVDLAEQFTEMIVTQRAYQSNARVITTSDQLLATATQLIR